jgi:hypothetical protein
MCRTKTELNAKVDEYRKIRATIDRLNTQLDAIKEDIIEYVVKHGDCDESKTSKPISVNGVDYKLMYLTVVRENLDKKQLKADLGDDYAKYATDSITHQLRVS